MKGEGLEGLGEEGEAGFERLDEGLDHCPFGFRRRVAGRALGSRRRGRDGISPLSSSLELPSQPDRLELHPSNLIDHLDPKREPAIAQVLLDVLGVVEDLGEVEDGWRDHAGAG